MTVTQASCVTHEICDVFDLRNENGHFAFNFAAELAKRPDSLKTTLFDLCNTFCHNLCHRFSRLTFVRSAPLRRPNYPA